MDIRRFHGGVHPHDAEAVEELRQFQMGQDGEPCHVGEHDKQDLAGAKAAHGDRVIADALAWEASVNFGDQLESRNYANKPNVMNVLQHDVHHASFAARRKAYLEEKLEKKQKSNW